jgi:hypothetical protein
MKKDDLVRAKALLKKVVSAAGIIPRLNFYVK